jgi:hypothetical protein
LRLPKTSPVRHSLWMRTSMRSLPSISPATTARCSFPVAFSKKPWTVKRPYSVGTTVLATNVAPSVLRSCIVSSLPLQPLESQTAGQVTGQLLRFCL